MLSIVNFLNEENNHELLVVLYLCNRRYLKFRRNDGPHREFLVDIEVSNEFTLKFQLTIITEL